MKIRALTILQDELDKSLSWRIKEIADLKMSVVASSLSMARETLIRAGVPLVYAHWEGFVKQASEDYLNYVSNQNLKFGELASCFVVFGAKKHLANTTGSNRAHLNIAAVEFFRGCSEEKASLGVSGVINTRSNLKSDVFSDIALSLGVSLTPYSAYFNFIDESLLKRRNAIAHGEYLDLDATSFRGLADEVITLMRMYKTDIQNLATLGAFRNAA